MRHRLILVFSLIILFLVAFSLFAYDSDNFENLEWKSLGGPLGGIGYDIRINPHDKSIMYVTDANAGAFKSTDGGKTWFTINDGLNVTFGMSGDNIPVFCLTIDHHNTNTIWCGMQDQKGIFKSNNGGKTWRRMDDGIEGDAGITFRGITVHPNDPDIVYAAGEVSSFVWAGEPQPGAFFDKTKGIVYKTTNGGESWEQVWFGGNLARYIWINPNNPEIIYVSTGIFDREAANSDPESREGGGIGILKSTDGGETWKIFDKDNGLGSLYISSLFMHPEDPDTLIAGTGQDYYSSPDLLKNYPEPMEGVEAEKGGVYITTDGGESWERTLEANIISAVEICKSNPDIAYAANEFSCYRSEDGGRSWKKLNPETGPDNPYGPKGFIAGFPMDFAVDPDNADRLFVNNYGGGNFFSDNGGKTWSIASKGYTGAICNGGITIPEQDQSIVYVAARSGAFKSINNGGFFQGLGYEPARSQECSAIGVSSGDQETVLAGFCDVLARSEDGGRDWKLIDIPMRDAAQPLSIDFASSDPNTAYLGMGHIEFAFLREDEPGPANGIFKSVNAGRSWRSVARGDLRDANVCWVEVHPENPDTVYAATLTKGLFKTENGGRSWEEIFNNDSRVLRVSIHPDNSDEIVLAARGGIYHSRDGGKNWERYSGGIDPEARMSAALFDPRNPSIIWASDLWSGVYYVDLSEGKRLVPVNRGLEIRAVEHLEITNDGRYLYAATYGGGVYRLDF